MKKMKITTNKLATLSMLLLLTTTQIGFAMKISTEKPKQTSSAHRKSRVSALPIKPKEMTASIEKDPYNSKVTIQGNQLRTSLNIQYTTTKYLPCCAKLITQDQNKELTIQKQKLAVTNGSNIAIVNPNQNKKDTNQVLCRVPVIHGDIVTIKGADIFVKKKNGQEVKVATLIS